VSGVGVPQPPSSNKTPAPHSHRRAWHTL
jgi:hypothetical protein